MRNLLKITIILIFLICPALTTADTITLKDGQTFTGKMISRTDSTVIFEIGGQQMNFPLSNVQNVNVDFNAAPKTAAPASAPAPAPETPKVIQVQAGTPMTISLAAPLDSGKHAAGHRFTATLEANLMSGSIVAAPRGAIVHGRVVSAKKSGRVVGQAHMDISFTGIMVNNQMIPIQTTTISTSAGRTIGKTAKTAGAGAAIGGLADGSSGAKTGAKIGLGVSILTRGNQVHIAAGTLFDTRLTAPLTVN